MLTLGLLPLRLRLVASVATNIEHALAASDIVVHTPVVPQDVHMCAAVSGACEIEGRGSAQLRQEVLFCVKSPATHEYDSPLYTCSSKQGVAQPL